MELKKQLAKIRFIDLENKKQLIKLRISWAFIIYKNILKGGARHGIDRGFGNRSASFYHRIPAKLHKSNGRQSFSRTKNYLRNARLDKERLHAGRNFRIGQKKFKNKIEVKRRQKSWK